MKTQLLAGLMASALVAAPALANHEEQRDTAYDYATVIESQPIVKTIRVSTPRKECWDEDVVYRDSTGGANGVPTVVGGVLGGALGNAVGHHKRNKQVGAVVGAVLGATLGHAVAANNRSREVIHHGTEQRCEVYDDYHEEERIMGYRVRYRYNNQTYTTRMDTDPGDTIKVRVSVLPVYSSNY